MNRVLLIGFLFLSACFNQVSQGSAPTPTPTVDTIEIKITPSPTQTSTFTQAPSTTSTPVDCGPPEGWVIYTVQEGDTVASLAALFGISETALLKASCLGEGAVLFPGMILFVPFKPTHTPKFTKTPKPTEPTKTPKPKETKTLLPSTTATIKTPTKPPGYVFYDTGEMTNLDIPAVDQGYLSNYGWVHDSAQDHFQYHADSKLGMVMAYDYRPGSSGARDYVVLPTPMTYVTGQISYYDTGEADTTALFILNLTSEEPETYLGENKTIPGFYIWSRGGINYPTEIPQCSNCWVTLMFHFDGSTIYYYINGIEVAQESYTSTVDRFWITAGEGSSAIFDNCMIWEGAPSDKP